MMAIPEHVEAVLFDAGGVLLDLDYAYLRRLIEPRHRRIEKPHLSEAEARARLEIDRTIRGGGRVSETWRDYFHIILGHLGVPGPSHDEIIDSLWDAHQHVGLWTVAIPGALETVEELRRRGCRLGVVSNAEGQVARDLDNAGFASKFETVIDSFVVGVEKPDPAIFRLALDRMKLSAESTVFVGDVPAVDVAGARAAGIAPILLDRHDLCADVDAPRIRSIEELPELLGQNSEA